MAAAQRDPTNTYPSIAPLQRPSMSTQTIIDAAGADGAMPGMAALRASVWGDRLQRYVPMARTVGVSLSVYAVFAVQGMLLARWLGPQARGEFATAIFYTQALAYIGLFGAAFAVARRAAQQTDDLGALERAALRLGLTTSLITMTVVAGLSLAALPGEKKYLAPLCLLCSLYLPFEQMRLTLQAVDHGRGAFSLYNANRLFAALMLPMLLAAAWWAGWLTVGVVACLAVAAPALGLCHRLLYLHRRTALHERPSVLSMMNEGRPFALSVAVADGFNRLDVLLLVWLTSLTLQGYYAAAVAAAGMLAVAPTAVALFSFNAGARHSAAYSKRRLLAAATAVALMQVASTAAFALVLPPLMTLVFGSEFAAATPLALALLPAHGLGGCAIVAEGYLRGAGRATAGTWARLLGIVVMLGFVAATHGRWHELSVPYGFAAGQAACALAMLTAILRDHQDAPNELPVAPAGGKQ